MRDRQVSYPKGQRLKFARISTFQSYIFTSFVANLALPFFLLFLPLLASQIGASIFEIGLVGGASNAVYSFMPFLMGRFSDRAKLRKIFIVASLFLITVVSLLYTVITTPVALIVTRLFEGVGWAMLWPAIEAAISRYPGRDAKKGLSIFNVIWSLGAAIGPLVGSAIVFFTSIRFAFFATSVALLATILIDLYPFFLCNMRNGNQGIAPIITGEVPRAPQTRSESHRRIGNRSYMISMTLGAISVGILLTFFPPYAKSIGLSILMIGGVTFLYGLVRFIGYILFTKEKVHQFFLNEGSRIRNLLISICVMSFAAVFIVIPDQTGVLYAIIFMLMGGGYSVIYVIAQFAMVAEAHPEKMGTGAGLFESSIGIGSAAGPVIAGSISGNSLVIPFLVPAACLPVVLAFLSFSTRKRSS